MRLVRLVAAIAVIAGLWLGVAGVSRLLRPGQNPFAPGGAVLGGWHGEALTATGRRVELWLQLDAGRAVKCGRHCPQIEGVAVTCEPGGVRGRSEVWGRVKDRRLVLMTDDQGADPAALRPDRLEGAWPAEVLEIRSNLKAWRTAADPDGTLATRSIDHPDSAAPVVWRLQRFNGRAPERCPA